MGVTKQIATWASVRDALSHLVPPERIVVLAGLLGEACFEAAEGKDKRIAADMLLGSSLRMALDRISELSKSVN